MFKSVAIITFFSFVLSCSSQQTIQQPLAEKEMAIVEQPETYDSIYPTSDPSEYFEQFSEIIKRIQVTTFYTTYYFDDDQRVTPAMLSFQKAKKLARHTEDFNHSKSGTAVALQQRTDKLILMTCDHVVNVPETLYVYENTLKPNRNTPLQSITILNRKEYMIFNAPRLHDFTVIASNREIDLAIITSDVPTDFYYSIPTLELPLGDESRLKWGSIVYNFGFPVGNKMMVDGKVSNPEETSSVTVTFTHNALFNRGLSGGLVVALRGDIPHFEWVGIASASSATTEFVLKPSSKVFFEQDQRQMYSDTLFVERQLTINQGISKTIKPSVIRQFIQDNLSVIEREGFNLRRFTNKPS